MRTPSDKQIKYAQSISHNLNIPLPTQFTAKAYYDFIAKHQTENRLSTIDMELAEEVYSGMLH
jgi:exonuclease V gamma subunit